MGFRVLMGTLVIAGLTLAPSAAMAQAASAAKPDDSALKSKIETRLKASPTLKDDSIDVAVDHGVVTLTGTVDSKAQSLKAAQVAKIAGVTKVENKLDVHSAAADKPGTAGKAADAVVDTSKKVANKTKDAVAETGEAITDAWITTKLKADFVNEDTLKGSNINVDTDNHIVTLKGTVASPAGRARAVEIAKTTKGVTRVIDSLTIAPPK
jgi:hyperosmotically inducible protein